jgi:E3 ubiquitin-protein ligase HERC2
LFISVICICSGPLTFVFLNLGKLGHNSEENITAPTIIAGLDMLQVVQISAGCEHSGAITAAGELFTWGHGDGGRLGHGDSDARTTPTRVDALLHMHAR